MKKIIVIGAGVAGLAAAQKLKKAGHQVTVLEASNRIGGRIVTDRSFADFPIELGAEFIHGDKAATFDLIDKDKTVRGSKREDRGLKVGDRWLNRDEVRSFQEAQDGFYDYKLGGADLSVDEWASHLNVPEDVRNMAAYRISHVYLAKPHEIGVKELLHEEEVHHSGVGDYHFIEGYDSLSRVLSAGLDIKKDCAVCEIIYTNSNIEIKCDNGSNHRAEAVIVTVPVSVLKKNLIKFDPALPEEKLKAIKSISMGSATKIILKFKQCFWDDTVAFFITQRPNSVWWDPAYSRKGKHEFVLTGFLAHDEAHMIDSLDENAAIELSLKQLSEIFEKDVQDLFIKGMVVSWDKEKWIQGGYSFIPPGAFGSRQELAKPVGNKLFFAGEATAHDTNPATVHGAIESGWRAAKEVIES